MPQQNRTNALSGIWAASLMPLDKHLNCNHDLLFSHCSDLLKRGCEGIVLFGTTGEGPSFSLNEKRIILEKMIAKGFSPQKIILANGSASIPNTIELAAEVLKQGCAAFLISPPSFYKNITEEGVVSYYREIIRRAASPDLKIILYHIPQNTGIPITVSIIEKLLGEFPQNIIGIKESEGNLPFAKQLIDAFPGFKVWVGKERHISEAAAYGGSGAICGIANLYPETICGLYEKKEGNLDRILCVLKEFPFIPTAKTIMHWRNPSLSHWKAVRPPLALLNEAQQKELMARMRQEGLN